jgi:hypothetical protein
MRCLVRARVMLSIARGGRRGCPSVAAAGASGHVAPLTASRFGLADDQMDSILSDYWQVRCAACVSESGVDPTDLTLLRSQTLL